MRSEVALSDYARCAFEMGLSPAEFLERHNPMFRTAEAPLRPYSTTVDRFSNRCFQILLINNSVAPYSRDRPARQGVLHTATVLSPSDALRRVVNSIMIASVPVGTAGGLTEGQLEEFATARLVRRRGYDKLELEDDR